MGIPSSEMSYLKPGHVDAIVGDMFKMGMIHYSILVRAASLEATSNYSESHLYVTTKNTEILIKFLVVGRPLGFREEASPNTLGTAVRPRFVTSHLTKLFHHGVDHNATVVAMFLELNSMCLKCLICVTGVTIPQA